jgi:predicted amidohydrolase YtcJ
MAPTILSGVPVYTMDGPGSVHESLVMDDGVIKFVGSFDEARRRFPEAGSIVIDRGCVLPGFIDAHMHLREFSLLFRDLDLTSLTQPDELLEAVGEAARERDKDLWITGGGAGFSLIRSMTRYDLDAVSPDNPLLIYSRDMHSLLVNSRVLEWCHIDASRNDPLGGRIERDDSGAPTGLLRERAIDLVKRHMPEITGGELGSAIGRGVGRLLEQGITTFCDCSIYGTAPLMGELLSMYQRERLHARAVLMYDDRQAVRLESMGFQSLFGNERVRIGGCKVILDGSLSSMTAYMRDPYTGRQDAGMLLMEEDELHRILRRSYSRYIWVAVHAIGDGAVDIALRSFEKIMKDVRMPKLLRRIEHAQTLRDEDIERFAELDVIPVLNPAHIPFDRENALAFLGPNAHLEHRAGSLLAAGARLAFGSDAPAGPVNPLHGIYAAVERKDVTEGPEFRFFPRERIGLADAVHAYTMGSSAALGLERRLGSLEPGKRADLVVLSRDIFEPNSDALEDARVVMTVVDGEVVFDAKRQGEND